MIQAALDAPVRQHDDGSATGMHDLTIDYPQGRRGAVEVTACADSEFIETWKSMNGSGKVWQLDDLRGGWVVSAYPSARVKLLRQKLPEVLRQLEFRGITRLGSARSASTSSQAETEQLRGLHVVDAYQGEKTDKPGSVYLTIDDPA